MPKNQIENDVVLSLEEIALISEKIRESARNIEKMLGIIDEEKN